MHYPLGFGMLNAEPKAIKGKLNLKVTRFWQYPKVVEC